MSQPPPPPNQPPSGGFGPPQEPSSAYGYPQQPSGQPGEQPQQPQQPDPLSKNPPSSAQPPQAPQPGYGYPQQPAPGAGAQPPYPPQAPPSYGYPQQGPPPYGQPPAYGQPPYGQPPYGPYGQYPTQPMANAGQSGSGNGSGKILAIVAAVVAVLLIAGGGIWFLAGGDDDTEAKGDTKGTSEGGTNGGTEGETGVIKAEFAWKTDPPKVDKEDILTDVPGTWFVGKNIVKTTTSSTTAYDMDTGKEAWSIKMPRPKSCAAAHGMSGNKTVVQYGGRCEFVMAVDLATGKQLWKKELPSERATPTEFSYTEIAVSGNVAAVSWIGNAVGYDLTTGKQLWQQEENSECQDRGYSGGSQLVAKVECGFGGPQKVQGVGQKGEKKWEWSAPSGVDVLKVLSTDPVVLGVNAGGESSIDITDLMVLSDKGKLQHKISISKDRHNMGCRGISLSDCSGAVVDGDTLYISSQPHQGDADYGRTSEIIAFDLTTGKSKWLGEPTEEGQIVPVTVENGSLIAYEIPGYDRPGKVVRVDPETGKASPRMEMPSADVKREYDMASGSDVRPYWKDGHFFLVNNKFYASAGLSDLAIVAYH
ncbi:PQQ-binding-like beta-propeller repeat protein [Streptomyces macrosporus]|uniref:PQQ-binding-like beta-propeller repeat protein n=1 Tax=Streptomyces macrosporus TaxID=44032 RepID=A0ABN3KDD8_9ACTN